MKINELVDKLTKLQNLYPDANLYFTNESCVGATSEINFEDFYVDEDTNEIE